MTDTGHEPEIVSVSKISAESAEQFLRRAGCGYLRYLRFLWGIQRQRQTSDGVKHILLFPITTEKLHESGSRPNVITVLPAVTLLCPSLPPPPFIAHDRLCLITKATNAIFPNDRPPS
ncbi:hypothetical protein Bbelb_105590 [Branchiostoma belcheri]|nr:hypothetical protein Bbelb_105590 [Branchiostoma belcheri]